MNYWKAVPKGIWTITDTEDALMALEDAESRVVSDPALDRINVFGPSRKALIIDLRRIRTALSKEDMAEFVRSANKMLPETEQIEEAPRPYDPAAEADRRFNKGLDKSERP